jgi:hypothetical protein
MAVLPLFFSDMATLALALRFSTVQEGSAEYALFKEAVKKARIKIYQQLGTSTVASLVALPSEDNPTTESGIQRSAANRVEFLLVRLDMLRSLPVLFMDASASSREVWNQEPLARQNPGSPALEAEIRRVESEIATLFATLEDGLTETSGSTVQGGSYGNELDYDEFPLPATRSIQGGVLPGGQLFAGGLR